MSLLKMILGIDKQEAKNADHISISAAGGMSVRVSSYFMDPERREELLQMNEERKKQVDQLLLANKALVDRQKKLNKKLLDTTKAFAESDS